MTQLIAYLFFIVGLLAMMLGGLGFGAYWGLSTSTDEEFDPEITEKEYVFFISALMVVGVVLVACALGIER